MTRPLVSLLLGFAGGGCLAPNPEYDPSTPGGPTSGGSSGSRSSAGLVSESTTGPGAASGSGVTSAGTEEGAEGETSPAESSSSSNGSSSGPATSSSSSTGGTPQLDPADLGQDCLSSDGCRELGPTVVCCESEQCLGTCMIPCDEEADFPEAVCPFDGMGCHHEHCLFPCDDDDADCTQWPGFTCQHGGNTFCENDER